MLKAFFLCLFLNLIGMFVLGPLAGSASEMNMPVVSLMYYGFGFLLIVGSDLMFIKKVVARFKGVKS